MNKKHKMNLIIKVETEKEIKKMKCNRCFGTGLIKRDMVFVCENCKNEYSNCFICENKNKTKWIECVKCFGSGNIEHTPINKINQNINI